MKFNILILLGLIVFISTKKTKFTTEIKITSNEEEEEQQENSQNKNNTSSEEESDKEKKNESDNE